MPMLRAWRSVVLGSLLLGIALAAPEGESFKFDPDELPENAPRLKQIESQAQDLKSRIESLEAQRRPIALIRDPILNQYNANVAEIQTLATNSQKAAADIGKMERRLNLIQGTPAARNLETQLNNLKSSITQAQARAQFLAAANKSVEPELAALNTQIAPFDQGIAAAMKEVEQLRIDWVNIRVPQKKYDRADYERLFRVCDEWVRLDGVYPDAYLWRALARFELDERDEALQDVARALDLWESFHKGDLKGQRTWPGGLATRGFLLSTTRKNRKDSDADFTKARVNPEGKKSAEVQYLAGRAQYQFGDEKRAAGFFRSALKLDEEHLPSMHYLARVLATAKDEKLRSGEEAVELAEKVSKKTGRRSWRVVETLAYAYIQNDQPAEAVTAVDDLERLLPMEEKKRMTTLLGLLEKAPMEPLKKK